MAERSARREASTVAELVDRYWQRHASKQKAARDVRRHLDRYIISLFGIKHAADIVYADAERLHAHIAVGAPIQANRVMATFSKMLSLAECGVRASTVLELEVSSDAGFGRADAGVGVQVVE